MNKALTGAVLKASRRLRGIRQADVAADLGLVATALSHVEAGRNMASAEVLRGYGRRLVDEKDVDRFVELMRSGKEGDLQRIAELVFPEDPDQLIQAVSDRLTSGQRGSSQGWNFAPARLDSRRVNYSKPISETPRMFDQREPVMRALQSFIAMLGGRTLLSGRESQDFGMGFSMKCDLVETTHSLVVDVKSTNRFESRAVAEIVGKSVMLNKHGFRYVLCFTAQPNSRTDKLTLELAREYGASVIWPDPTTLMTDSPTFDGDRIL